MNTYLNALRWPRSAAMVGAYLLSASVLVGCGGGEDSTTGIVTPPGGEPTPIVVNSPAQIAQESADDYNDNENGLITGATLKRWKDDWLNERPAGITGKLVILQVTEGPGVPSTSCPMIRTYLPICLMVTNGLKPAPTA